MLHPELLRRLCFARDWLRVEDDPRPPVSQIARRAGIALHHFIRLFKAVFGETPHQYRARAQIERAKHLLVLTDRSVTDVCLAVGFSSLGSFTTLFTRHTGVPPSVFRRRHQCKSGQPDRLPDALAPGCFSLMSGLPVQKGNFQEANVADSS